VGLPHRERPYTGRMDNYGAQGVTRAYKGKASKLTKLQHGYLTFIAGFFLEHQWWPSLRELMERFGVTSTNAVETVLRRLEGKGYLFRAPMASRAMRITPEGYAALEAPCDHDPAG
jgi:SOS-response transcriptional repressor LexA